VELIQDFRIDGNDTASFVASEVGEGVTCINPQTVASTPIGIFFLSHDGVYLLSASSQDPIMLASSLINAKFLSVLPFRIYGLCIIISMECILSGMAQLYMC
jgi:hypothetical protein